jgi:acetyltransferase-like isoleucine patch superfamily enzyme
MLLRRIAYFAYIHTMSSEWDFMVAVRRFLLRIMLRLPLDQLIVRPHVYIFGWRRLKMGAHVSLNHGCFVSADGGLEIGDYVAIGHGASILTTEHSFQEPATPIKYQPAKFLPVRIGSNVWIGANVTILAGVSIADGTVVAAGSVVTRSVSAPETIVGGVPARFIKHRLSDDLIART